LTIIFVITMPHDKFNLDMELKKHKEALKHQLCLSYRRHHSDLHTHHCRIYFKNVDSRDSAVVANTKVEARANVPDGIS
jgi:hypothetical protein